MSRESKVILQPNYQRKTSFNLISVQLVLELINPKWTEKGMNDNYKYMLIDTKKANICSRFNEEESYRDCR